MAHIKEVSKFFNASEKRQDKLANNIIRYCPESKRSKLLDVCRTRWCGRIDAMALFEELFVAIVITLEELSLDKSQKDALPLFKLLHDFQFVVTMCVVRSVLERTLPATKLLQKKNADIIDGIDIVTSLKDLSDDMVVDAQKYHDVWYGRAKDIASKLNIKESKRRTCGRQTKRANHPHTSISDYYYKALTKEFLSHLQSQLASRFADTSSMVSYEGLAVVPSKVLSSYYSLNKFNWREKFRTFVNFYHDDLPKLHVLEGELDMWERFWLTTKASVPNTVLTTLRFISPFKVAFPNIYNALRILVTLPITSCECERSFSAMRKLKTCFRSRMTEERLNGLSLMYIHPEIAPDVDQVIDDFAARRPRRLDFSI